MVGSSILNINALAVSDDSIIRKEIYPYSPYTTTYKNSDEIRIAIQSQDSYLLPCESFLYIQITAHTSGTHATAHNEINFVNNFASFLFSDVRYELNGVEIDRVRNIGRASTMKLMIASRSSELVGYKSFCDAMASTSPRGMKATDAEAADPFPTTTYDIILPLSSWFGFCDDYRKVILNCKHELILNRSANSLNCIAGGSAAVGATKIELRMDKIQWKMPHVTLSDKFKLGMLNYLSKNRKITIQHRSMDLVEYPQLSQTSSHMWQVKTVSHVNRPRFVVVGFQTNRDNLITANSSQFDDANVREIRLHLNSQIYPYNMNEINLKAGQYAELFDMYSHIHSSYYNGAEAANPFGSSFLDYQSCPVFAFDTTRADESLIDSAVDVKVEIKTHENIPEKTTAFCLIVYDNEFTYSPFDGLVVRNI